MNKSQEFDDFSRVPKIDFRHIGGIGGRGGIKMASATHHQLMSQQGTHFSPHSKAKANYKSTNLGKLVTSGISDVVTASVHSEKTCMKMYDDYDNY